MPVIELNGLTKRFGSVTAVKQLDLRIQEGEIFGFLGPNGAGKSTTINMMLDFVKPSRGSAQVFGKDCRSEGKSIRQHIGVLPEGYDVYNRLTGIQHLEFAIDSKNANSDPYELLDRVGLADDAGRKAGNYSKGMAQRLTLAMALVGEPDLLILDEPTTGLDPNGAREVRKIIQEEHARGATVFFSSHILGQVEAVCDRVGILRKGELVADDSIEDLRSNIGAGETLVVEGTGLSDGIVGSIRSMDGVSDVVERQPGRVLAISVDADLNKTTVLSRIEEEGGTVDDFSTEEASLEDLFAAYTTGGEPA